MNNVAAERQKQAIRMVRLLERHGLLTSGELMREMDLPPHLFATIRPYAEEAAAARGQGMGWVNVDRRKLWLVSAHPAQLVTRAVEMHQGTCTRAMNAAARHSTMIMALDSDPSRSTIGQRIIDLGLEASRSATAVDVARVSAADDPDAQKEMARKRARRERWLAK